MNVIAVISNNQSYVFLFDDDAASSAAVIRVVRQMLIDRKIDCETAESVFRRVVGMEASRQG